MSEILNIDSITDLNDIMGYPKPSHPLICVVDLAQTEISSAIHRKIACSFYAISLKTKYSASPVLYGQNYFDFQEGVLLGMSPGQVFSVEENIAKGDLHGWALYFHPDILKGYSIQEALGKFGFFDYATHEALHLSDKERSTLNDITLNIKAEAESNLDVYSSDLLVSNLEVLLNYIRRFYGRQFLTRKVVNSDLLSSFERLLNTYFDSTDLQDYGLPSVGYFSSKLNLSSSYFSDLLKKETGMNAQDNIHTFVMKKAKTILVNTNKSVSEIAYELGFEYPQYFSRLFKKKTGKSPSEYRMETL